MTDDNRRRKDAESWYKDNCADLNNMWDYPRELCQVTRFTAEEIEGRMEAAKREFVVSTLLEGGYR